MPALGKRCAFTLLAAAALFIAQAVPAQARSVTVFAAASLKDALDEIDAQYQAKGGTKAAAISYAATPALARQIESGAPADIFISADLAWMDYLEKRRLVRPGTRINLLRNDIVLIAPADSTATVTIGPKFPLAKLLRDGRLAMADPDSVPAGKYGRAALETLDVWPSVKDRIARAENVRAALNFVSRGEAPLGVVYRSDAVADRRVRVMGAFPADTHPPIIYPAALLVGGRSPAAEKYFDFLTSNEAKGIFKRHGFAPY